MEINNTLEQKEVNKVAVIKHLGYSLASFYRRLKPNSKSNSNKQLSDVDKSLLVKIKELSLKYPRFGYRKIRAILKREGTIISESKTYRLMKKGGLLLPKNKEKKAKRKKDKEKLLKPTKPNEVWQMDITYIWIEKYGWYFLINVIDYFSRFLLVSIFTDSFCSKNIILALEEALKKANSIFGAILYKIRLITDNGISFTSRRFQKYLNSAGIFNHIRISYRSPELIGLVERLHLTLKEEEIWPKEYCDPIEAEKELKKFIEFYNNERPHQALNYLTPWEVYSGEYIKDENGLWVKKEKLNLTLPNEALTDQIFCCNFFSK